MLLSLVKKNYKYITKSVISGWLIYSFPQGSRSLLQGSVVNVSQGPLQALQKIPRASQGVPNISAQTARFQIPYGPAGTLKTPRHHYITGSGLGKNLQSLKACCQLHATSSLYGSNPLHGTSRILIYSLMF